MKFFSVLERLIFTRIILGLTFLRVKLIHFEQSVTGKGSDTRRKQLTCNDFVTQQDAQESCLCN